MSSLVKITYFVGALVAAFVFTKVSVQLVSSMFTTFYVLPPTTPLEYLGALIIVVATVSCLLFTIGLYVCVIWLMVKELTQHRQRPPVQPSRQKAPSTNPRVARPPLVVSHQRHYRPSRPSADDRDWLEY